METEKNICIELLELYGQAENLNPEDIKNFKIHKSQSYALGPVYAFDYKDSHYYVVDDYSLGDEPVLVKDILLDINHSLKGRLVKNPIPQDDDAKYASGLNGIEYYLWQDLKD